MENEYRKSPEQMKKTIWIMWGALLFSMIIYAGLGLILRAQSGAPQDAQGYTTMLIPLLIFGLLETAFITMLWSKVLPPTRGDLRAFFTPFILRMALSESIGLFGFVLSFLGAPLEIFLGFLAWGFLLQLSLAPTENALEDFRRKYSAQGQAT